MSGVVNVITKTPRELAAEGGSSLTIGVGGFPRSAQGVDRDAGSLFYVNGSHAQAVNDKVAYKISAGYFTQDALPRPVGHDHQPVQHAVPGLHQRGHQPAEVRRARGLLARRQRHAHLQRRRVGHRRASSTPASDRSTSTRGSYLSYFSAKYQKGARRVAFFTNLLTADSTNLLSRGPTRRLPAARIRHQDVRRRGRRLAGHRHAQRADVRRQLPPQHLRRLAGAERRRPQRGRRLRAGRDLLRPITCAGWSAAAWTSSRRSTTPCSRLARRCC